MQHSACNTTSLDIFTTSTGKLPMAVSFASEIPSQPSNTAFAASDASALVGKLLSYKYLIKFVRINELKRYCH